MGTMTTETIVIQRGVGGGRRKRQGEAYYGYPREGGRERARERGC